MNNQRKEGEEIDGLFWDDKDLLIGNEEFVRRSITYINDIWFSGIYISWWKEVELIVIYQLSLHFVKNTWFPLLNTPFPVMFETPLMHNFN